MRINLCLCAAVVSGLFFLQPASNALAQDFIAGTTPDQRPAGAPVIRFFPHSADWYESALHGVSRPYPKSLSFIDNQGGWFNPFLRPGMTGGYDLRGHHKSQ